MQQIPLAPNNMVDRAGRLTPEGRMYFQTLVAYIRALEARITALGG